MDSGKKNHSAYLRYVPNELDKVLKEFNQVLSNKVGLKIKRADSDRKMAKLFRDLLEKDIEEPKKGFKI